MDEPILKRRKYNKRGDGRYPDYHKEYRQRVREKLFEVYGCRCAICGFDDKRALQLDHINGDGAEERGSRFVNGVRTSSKSIMSIWVMAIRVPDHTRYRILCANCNWIHRVENKLYLKRGKRELYESTPF